MNALVTEYGADANANDYRDETPLHYAAENGYIEVVKVLVTECGADVEAKEYRGTPLHYASKNGPPKW